MQIDHDPETDRRLVDFLGGLLFIGACIAFVVIFTPVFKALLG